MPDTPSATTSQLESLPSVATDDAITMVAISIVASILSDVIHEGFGHGLTALLTGADSGVLTSVAWSSAFDSRLVDAGGTLANLAAALVFWLALKTATRASVATRYFLLVSCAFNLFSGTGYFCFSGVTNFGDWSMVIAGMNHHALWRTLLIVGGAALYFLSVLVVGTGLVHYVGVPRNQQKRLRKLTAIPYFSAIVISSLAALLNPLGIQLLWESALAATAGGQSGLLWLQYYIPRETAPKTNCDAIPRCYRWIIVAGILAVIFIAVLGPGITLHR